eukprot:CAMPEP_0197262686 /NCGR_PEP_ID=MMETSP1432-20130617/636_1 /TAXON_ID=44447 /ORGANISM="Pseudo-nitzschia delicatissima, Strain UNC1205" /LENGTH=165 /DNA_ID=CAMNT_0042727001 /DNA_START=54 /DNA_END=551 /DNA_ORIENTATION=-
MTDSIDDGKTEIITDDPNPLKKLIEGFCTPAKIPQPPTLDEDVDSKYQPDLTPQKPTPVDPIDPVPETPTTTTEEEAEQESAPEKKVIANRRKHGIEIFIMALLFVVGTLLTLNKLGHTTSGMVNVVDKSSVEPVEVEAEPVAAVEVEVEEEEEEIATEEVEEEL